MNFPEDHYNHPNLKTEWWYFAGIGKLDNNPTNYHISFFRKFSSQLKKNVYFAHFGFRKNGKFEFKEKKSDQANSSINNLQVIIDDWDLHKYRNRFLVLMEKNISLIHIARKKPAVHKSGYYSITDMNIHGSINGELFEGNGWFDHEFSDLSAMEIQMIPYHWVALQLNKGIEIMLYVIPKFPAKSFGTLIFPSGETKQIFPGDYCLKPGATNFGWILELPDYGMEFSLEKQSEAKITHALGPDYIEGTFNVVSRKKIGQGFYEITGGEL